MNKKHSGFTLIELMIVVAIISILAMVVYPSYLDSVSKSRRVDAQASLQGFAQALERYYTTEGTYLGAASGGGNTGAPTVFSTKSPIDGADTFYNLTIHSATASSYVVVAEPVAAQSGNGILILKSTGARGWDDDNSVGGVASGLGTSPNELAATEMCWKESC